MSESSAFHDRSDTGSADAVGSHPISYPAEDAPRGSRIARLDAIPVVVPWRSDENATAARGYKWAFGEKLGGAAVLVRLESEDGHVGWGEASSLFHPSMPASLVADAIRSLAPLVIGRRCTDIESFLSASYNRAGWHFARSFGNYVLSGIEMAMWDMVGQIAGLSLCDLMGGRTRDTVNFMYFVYRDRPEQMCAEARRAVDEGYDCIYLKVGISLVEDLTLVEALRSAIGPHVRLRIDANEAWSTATAVRMMRALEDLDLEFVEQPVMAQDLQGLAQVRLRTTTPICADQSARNPQALLAVIQAGAADIVSLCPGDAGGLLAARKSAAIAEAAALPVFIHSNIELGVGTAAHIHLAASLSHCHYASQTEHQFLSGDVLSDGQLPHRGGLYDIPTGPGLGVKIDEVRIKHYHELFRSSHYNAPQVGLDRIPALPRY